MHMDMTSPQTELPQATTAADGVLRLSVEGIEPGSYVIDVDFDGDLELWPASASTTIAID